MTDPSREQDDATTFDRLHRLTCTIEEFDSAFEYDSGVIEGVVVYGPLVASGGERPAKEVQAGGGSRV